MTSTTPRPIGRGVDASPDEDCRAHAMFASAYRRRCPQCGAVTLTAATRCPQCGEALASRDDSGRPLAWWGCPGCLTLNPTDRATCHHCSAARPRWRRVVRWGTILVVLVGVAAFLLARAGRPPAPIADVFPAGPVVVPRVTPAPITRADSGVAPSPDTLPPPQPAGPVTITWVNVRNAPDRDARILGVLDPDTPVVILESDVGWHRVRAGTLTGWIYAEGLTQP